MGRATEMVHPLIIEIRVMFVVRIIGPEYFRKLLLMICLTIQSSGLSICGLVVDEITINDKVFV